MLKNESLYSIIDAFCDNVADLSGTEEDVEDRTKHRSF